ncbi:hypothetical protein [Bifidobacterium moukalabense]|uniref:Oligoribonuclease n=1 Tax=Bifidobacterium moukalabense DSM 27321 TaxID=1435051 RepID=W4NB39_9BIFI|nr:hypothetical protein [Bifidobacterium moukalabense]ETY72234.1 oligoribonuclease [Bifidobacterium moukalabense DSM 27321]
MTSRPDMLLWMDVETMGLDPDTDILLEIGMQCTSMDASETIDTLHRIISPDKGRLTIGEREVTAFECHAANGLLREALEAYPSCDRQSAANMAGKFVAGLAQRFTLHPAGSNVAFDLDWQTVGRDPYDSGHTSTHRVMDCIDRDIRDYMAMLAQVRGVVV